jgi:Fe-S cluster assembly ATP-binding protein
MLCLRLQRLLDYIKPDFVHIMEAGRITTTGKPFSRI